jgi:ribosomal-protein-alanine N-acetyltransferase
VTTIEALNSAGRRKADSARLRPVVLDDLPAVERLEKEVFLDLAYSMPYLRSLYDLFSSTWFVADDNGELAGYAVVGISSDKRTSWLLGLAVSDRYRRQGLGGRLMGKTLQTMMDADITDAFLTVRPHNDPARRIYHNFEFTLLRTERNYYGNNEPREILHRSLTDNPYRAKSHPEAQDEPDLAPASPTAR